MQIFYWKGMKMFRLTTVRRNVILHRLNEAMKLERTRDFDYRIFLTTKVDIPGEVQQRQFKGA